MKKQHGYPAYLPMAMPPTPKPHTARHLAYALIGAAAISYGTKAHNHYYDSPNIFERTAPLIDKTNRDPQKNAESFTKLHKMVDGLSQSREARCMSETEFRAEVVFGSKMTGKKMLELKNIDPYNSCKAVNELTESVPKRGYGIIAGIGGVVGAYGATRFLYSATKLAIKAANSIARATAKAISEAVSAIQRKFAKPPKTVEELYGPKIDPTKCISSDEPGLEIPSIAPQANLKQYSEFEAKYFAIHGRLPTAEDSAVIAWPNPLKSP